MPAPTTCSRRPDGSRGRATDVSPLPCPSSRPFRASARTPPAPSRRSRSVDPWSRSRRTVGGLRPVGPGRRGTCGPRSSAPDSRRPSHRSYPPRTPASSTRRSWSSGRRSVGRPDRTARPAPSPSCAARNVSSRTPGRCRGAPSAATDRTYGPRSSFWPTAVDGSSSVERRPVSFRASGSSRVGRSAPGSVRRPRRDGN